MDTAGHNDRPAVAWALLAVRVVVGIILMAHGAQKVFGAFGGPGLAELFLTTSREGLPGDTGAAGSIFRCTPGRTGLAPLPAG